MQRQLAGGGPRDGPGKTEGRKPSPSWRLSPGHQSQSRHAEKGTLCAPLSWLAPPVPRGAGPWAQAEHTGRPPNPAHRDGVFCPAAPNGEETWNHPQFGPPHPMGRGPTHHRHPAPRAPQVPTPFMSSAQTQVKRDRTGGAGPGPWGPTGLSHQTPGSGLPWPSQSGLGGRADHRPGKWVPGSIVLPRAG